MATAASAGFATATELADTLIRTCGLAFRLAHGVVGLLVARAVADDVRPDTWTLETVRDAAAEANLGVSGLAEADVRNALTPQSNVERRSAQGGPARSELERMLGQRIAQLDEDRHHHLALRRRVGAAAKNLAEAADRQRLQSRGA